MTIDTEVHEFLNRERPALLASVATNGKEGYPLVVPVWYRWNGKEIVVWTLDSRLWVRNAARDARVGVSIQDQLNDGFAVIMRGRARVETSDQSHIDEEIRKISRRYLPQPEVESYVHSWQSLRSMVYIEPTRLFVWR